MERDGLIARGKLAICFTKYIRGVLKCWPSYDGITKY